PDVALDGEVGQVDVSAATVGGPLAVEADPGVHRAVGRGLAQRDLSALDNAVPVAGPGDRHVVDDDVPVDLEGARRDVHRTILALRVGDGPVEGVGGVTPATRVSAEVDDVDALRDSPGRADVLRVEQVDDRPVRPGAP